MSTVFIRHDRGNMTVAAPFYVFNEDDHTALIASVSLIFALLSITSIVAKLFVRRGLHSLHLFDYVLFLGTAILLLQTSLIIVAAKEGLGMHSDMSGDKKEKIRKLQYSASILAILVTACTKISMSLLIKMINDCGRLRSANRALLALISLFSFSGILASIFQCPLPSPWLASDSASCPSIKSIYSFVNINNMITDILLCILAVAMVWNVQTTRETKVLVIVLFTFRIICPIIAISSLLDTQHLYNGPEDDFTWLSVAPTTWLQASYNLSVITVCVPSIKVVFDSFFGNGTKMALDIPYELEHVSSKMDYTKDATSKITTVRRNQTACYSETKNKKYDDGQSESVQNLTDELTIREEFELHYDDHKAGSTSLDESHSL